MLEDRCVIDSPLTVLLYCRLVMCIASSAICVNKYTFFSPGSNPIFSTVVIVSLQYPYHGWHVLRFFWMRNKTYLAEQLPCSVQARLFITSGAMSKINHLSLYVRGEHLTYWSPAPFLF